jgi:uncharacterized protein (TIGR03084 family)
MSFSLDRLIDDLAAEHAALEAVLTVLPAEMWDSPTHAPGWSVRDQVAHLAHFDAMAARILTSGVDAFAEERARGAGAPSFLDRGRAMPSEQVLDWWRTRSRDLIVAARGADRKQRLPWGRDMSPASFLTARLMETWSHGLDVVDVVGVDRPDDDRLRHVAQLGVSTRPHSYKVRGLPMPDIPIRVELVLPSGEPWLWGDPAAADRIAGTATDFCRVATQRRHVTDTGLDIRGDAATEWMMIAQAFAGPPGVGRQPGEFTRRRSE